MSLHSIVGNAPLAQRPNMRFGRTRRTLLCTSALLASTGLASSPAGARDALPTGGTVASGGATISGTSSSVTVTQSSDRAIINWQGFSVGKGNSVTFNQPGAQSATLNRVTGSTGSEIAGQIRANGAVYLINPNGIAITKSGAVQTGGGFVASTLDIGDADFNAGKLNFAGKGASAAVSNAGAIAATKGAYVALLGGSVSNSGTISVPLGKVGLGSGEQIGLDINGDHFMQVAMPTSTVVANGGALVDMSGTVTAAGGRVTLSAASVKNAVRNIINLSGTISADSAIGTAGAIELLGGEGGTVTASGALSARATGETGDGGRIETSGAAVNFAGLKVDTTAAHGSTGTWLVDPTDLTVNAAAATTINANLATSNVTLLTDGYTATGPGVTSSGNGDITINSALAWTGANALTLNSYHDININAAITAPNGGLTLMAGNPYGLVTTIRDTAPLSIGTFLLNYGNWVQNSASLPSFSATDFRMANPNAGSFLRVTGGDGSSANPYLLTDAYGLQGLRGYSLLAQNFALASDIDASGTAGWNGGAGFAPIGDNNPFTGSLDGRGHVINGLTINQAVDSVALIARDQGKISNIGLVGGSITGASRVAALVGYQFAAGSVTNAYSSATINSTNGYVGGLVADQFGSVTNSYATGAVNGGGDNVGGLVGVMEAGAVLTGSHATGNVTVIGRTSGIGGLVGASYGTIDNSYATGTVAGSNGGSAVGGLVGVVCSHANGCSGDNAALATVTNSYATGDVSGDNGDVGGLIGLAYNATITNSYAGGKVLDTGNGQGFGGLIGATNGGITLTNVHAIGDVSGGGDVGGLVGTATGAAISQSYATGNVSASIQSTGNTTYGGLVGRMNQDSSITQSHATGSVTHAYTGNAYGSSVGGLVGAANGYITYSYATGAVTGTNDAIGGLIGSENNQSGVTDTNNYATGNVVGNTLPDAYFSGATMGGLIGQLNGNETITASYATGSVSAVDHTGGSDGGGLIGRVAFVNLNLTKSFASGSVSITGAVSAPDAQGYQVNTVRNYVGGLIGENDSNGLIDQVYASGSVVADGQSSNIGGLIGYNRTADGVAIISNSYATGAVLGSAYNIRYSPGTGAYYGDAYNKGGQSIGGLIGNMYSGTVENSYSAGGVNGAPNSQTIGGLVGWLESCAPNCGVARSYWDMTASGIATSGAGTGLTTAQMQSQTKYATTYPGWDFDTIWAPPSSGHYPQLYALTPVVFATAGNATTTYGTAPTSLGTYVGGPNSYVFGPANDRLTGFLAGSTTATVTSNVGHYAVTPFVGGTTTSTGGVIYRVVAGGGGTLTIDPAQIVVTDISAALVGNVSKIYDGKTTALLAPGNFSLSGFMNGDGAAVTQTVGAYASVNAGIGILVTAKLSTGDFTANVGTNLSNYVLPTIASGTIGTITPATLNLLYTADPLSRIYGNANPALTGKTTAVSGLVAGDSLSAVTSGTATFVTKAGATSGVGSYAVTGSGIASASGNYVVAASQAAGDATALKVTPRSVAVAANGATSVYGAAVPKLTYATGAATAATGLVNGDALSGALASAGSASSNVGQYAITQGTLGNPNYNLVYTGATLNITPAMLAILYSATPSTSIYGNAIGTLGGTASANGLVNGDTLAGVTTGSASFTTSATGKSGIGTYAVTGTGVKLNSQNYTASSVQAAGNATALKVTARTVAVVANGATSVYGAAVPKLTYATGATTATTGLVNGDALSGALASAGSATSNVGQYAITQGTLSNPNYHLVYTGATLNITPAMLAILYSATPSTSLYGNAIGTLSGTASANGLVNGDTLAGVTTGSASFTTSATAKSGVGTYAVTGTGVKLSSQNYTASSVQAAGNATALKVTARNVAVAANGATSVYGAAVPKLTYATGAATATTGLVNGDALSGALASAGSATSNVGQYAITQGTLGNPNYNLVYTGATLNITPAMLAILYSATPSTSIYGNAIGTLGGTASANGLVNGDTLAGVTAGSASFTTSATANSGVGTYAVTGTGVKLKSQNYTATFAQAAGNATALKITPRSISVTADAQRRAILLNNPALTYTVGGLGLVNGDRLTGKLATTAQLLSPTGVYPITQGTLAASSNYYLTYIGGKLTVTPPPLSLTDFLSWLRQVVVQFETQDRNCAAGSVSMALRTGGSVTLTKANCTR